MEKTIGKITHFFPKIGVAVIELSEDICNGDEIMIKGRITNFRQPVSSIESEHKQLEKASAGMSVGLKMDKSVEKGDIVYKII